MQESAEKVRIMNFTGVIIEESLEDTSVLNDVKIISTKVEQVTEKHKTPWLKQWTLHTVEVEEDKGEEIAQKISKSIHGEHGNSWYTDLKSDKIHYVIFRNKVFRIDRSSKEQYAEATRYGISLDIPDYQVDFSNEVVKWKR